MRIERQQDVTPAVLEVMQRTQNPRLREIMSSLVTHLHGFVRDVRLTEAEFRDAAAILNELGKLSGDSHNETVLMAGSLGVSTLVCLLNNGDSGNTETSQSLLGPFWRLNAPRIENGGSILLSETPGDPLFVSARVQDRAGKPVEGAEVDVWHASPIGRYENQDPVQAAMNPRGKFTTDAEGRFCAGFSDARARRCCGALRLRASEKRHGTRDQRRHAGPSTALPVTIVDANWPDLDATS